MARDPVLPPGDVPPLATIPSENSMKLLDTYIYLARTGKSAYLLNPFRQLSVRLIFEIVGVSRTRAKLTAVAF